MVSKVTAATMLFRKYIVDSVCESLDLGLNFCDKDAGVVYESLDSGSIVIVVVS